LVVKKKIKKKKMKRKLIVEGNSKRIRRKNFNAPPPLVVEMFGEQEYPPIPNARDVLSKEEFLKLEKQIMEQSQLFFR
jgi:hypothetical protein